MLRTHTYLNGGVLVVKRFAETIASLRDRVDRGEGRGCGDDAAAAAGWPDQATAGGAAQLRHDAGGEVWSGGAIYPAFGFRDGAAAAVREKRCGKTSPCVEFRHLICLARACLGKRSM